MEDHVVAEYIDTTFGGAERVTRDILYDFFRSAFDGSGADNFFDAGHLPNSEPQTPNPEPTTHNPQPTTHNQPQPQTPTPNPKAQIPNPETPGETRIKPILHRRVRTRRAADVSTSPKP